jgi:hypothetical protein
MNMKSLKIQTATLLVALAFAGGLWATPVSAQSNQIAGYWLLSGSAEPASGIGTFTNLVTLTEGGQIVNVDPNLGTAVGSWKRIAGKQYAITFSGFLDGDGSRYVVTAEITLDPATQQFDGPFHTQFLDPTGFPFFDFTGAVSAFRQ